MGFDEKSAKRIGRAVKTVEKHFTSKQPHLKNWPTPPGSGGQTRVAVLNADIEFLDPDTHEIHSETAKLLTSDVDGSVINLVESDADEINVYNPYDYTIKSNGVIVVMEIEGGYWIPVTVQCNPHEWEAEE